MRFIGMCRWILHPPQGEIFIHYGSPLVTAANTVIVPVKTGTNSFRVDAHNGATGKRLWLLNDWLAGAGANFIPGLGPTISGNQLFVPDIAGRVLVRQNPDQAKGTVTRLYFYGVKNYRKNPTAYQQNVQIDTPLTTDANGNLYFGFIVLGPTPLNLQSGIARIAPNGTGTWVSAATASGDPTITQVAISCAPALSPDGSLLYVAVNNEQLWISAGAEQHDARAGGSRAFDRSVFGDGRDALRWQFRHSDGRTGWRCLLRRAGKSFSQSQ